MDRKKKTKKLSFCSPHIKTKKNDKTCFDKETLVEMIKSWNNSYSNKIKINKSDSKNKLWDKLRKKMSSKCENDVCLVKQDFISNSNNNNSNNNNNNNLSETKLKYFLKPERPRSWKKKPNEWLDTNNINDVMKRYEMKHKDFKFFGAVPIDFDLKSGFGGCMISELCKIDIQKTYNKGTRKIGVIFNLDKHDQYGSHWISMYCDLNKKIIGYWDSYGYEAPEEINNLMEKIKTQAKDNLKIKCVIKINKVRHQYKGSECGVYCLYFITEQLDKKKSFEKVTKKIVKDDEMLRKRKTFFNYI
jgi:hypothetical protein